MQAKRPINKVTSISKSSSRSSIKSPEKSFISTSPLKSTGKASPVIPLIKDYFTYTPLRQSKSSTASNPDLSFNKSANKEIKPKQTSTIKKIFLDQTLLREKLRNLQINKSSHTQRSNSHRFRSGHLLNIVKILEKLKFKLNSKTLKEAFAIFTNSFRIYQEKIIGLYKNKLKNKAFAILKAELKKNLGIYNKKLKRKIFAAWKLSIFNFRNLSHKNAILDKDLDSSFNSVTIEDEDLINIAERYYQNSLLHYLGIMPWKKLTIQNKHKSKQRRLAADKFRLTLMIKGFNTIYAYFTTCIKKPTALFRLKTLQKSFRYLKTSHQDHKLNIKIADLIHTVTHTQHTLKSTSLTSWKVFLHLKRLLKSSNSHRQALFEKIRSLKN